jgi:Flp pilus assembly protein TadD
MTTGTATSVAVARATQERSHTRPPIFASLPLYQLSTIHYQLTPVSQTISIETALQLALQRHQEGKKAEAAAICQEILRVAPGNAGALHLLGIFAYQAGQHSQAIGLIRQSLALEPRSAMVLNNLGLVLRAQGNFPEAEAALLSALEIDPTLTDAHNNLGIVLRETRRVDAALTSFRKAIDLSPGHLLARHNLAAALMTLGRNEEAVALLRETQAMDPRQGSTLLLLGNALRNLDRLDDAIDAYKKALVIDPSDCAAMSNLGFVLRDLSRFDEAEAWLRAALKVDPNYQAAHANLSLILLVQGKFEDGWREYEWRPIENSTGRPVEYPQPRWDGSKFSGRTLLLRCDQGHGDTILAARFVPEILKRGGNLIVECEASLLRLLGAMPGVGAARLVPAMKSHKPANVEFDLQLPQMSLWKVMGIHSPADIPAPVSYLAVDPSWREKWQDVNVADHNALKVGLVWAGSAVHLNDRNRSMLLEKFAPLGTTGARFYSLQKGPQAVQARTPPPGLVITDLMNRIEDFADTAAFVDALDLVISVDTSVAHLAGALGKPVWLLLPAPPDFRWLLEREDSPWYPTMRLFRQPSRGDWDSVMRRVADELARARVQGVRVQGSGFRSKRVKNKE